MFYAANLGKSRTNIDSVSCQNILSKEARTNCLFKGGSRGYVKGTIFLPGQVNLSKSKQQLV
jgi:hypothetical protein